MDRQWILNGFKFRKAFLFAMTFMFYQNFKCCCSLNQQGFLLSRFGALTNWKLKDGPSDRCLWFGARCSNGKVVTLNRDQPGDNARRMLLRVADISSPSKSKSHKVPPASVFSFPPSFPPSLSPSPSHSKTKLLSPSLLPPFPSPSESPLSSPVESPSTLLLQSPTELPTQVSPAAAPPPIITLAPPEHDTIVMTPASNPNQVVNNESKHRIVLIAGIVGGSMLLLISTASTLVFRSSKVVTVRPWATGLSGQLQKAFITGVPKLKRSEIEAACEDFSNIIGYFSNGTVYKGTLSSGVEIAVTSTGAISRKEWSKNLEAQFRKKIATLSKVNHKNFVNLIGYCEEEDPFTRMMVFEYAPNGTLFEHLHIKEAEHLEWGVRLRIAMGMAYCLEYMHQLSPPVVHENLISSSIHLTEDYAAKVSDFSLWNNVNAAKKESDCMEVVEPTSANPESNVNSFGLILYEMITGRNPNALDKDSLVDWTPNNLKGMVDSTLKHYEEDELEKLISVMSSCIQPDAKKRLTMSEILAKLKEITSIGPDGATPKLSPLWWAQLEIMSTEGS